MDIAARIPSKRTGWFFMTSSRAREGGREMKGKEELEVWNVVRYLAMSSRLSLGVGRG